MPTVYQQKHVRNPLFIREKGVQSLGPFLLFRLRDPREAVSRQIRQNKRSEIEIVHQPRPAGFAARLCQLFSVGQHIDERAFAHVGFSADGDRRFIEREKLLFVRRRSDKHRVFHDEGRTELTGRELSARCGRRFFIRLIHGHSFLLFFSGSGLRPKEALRRRARAERVLFSALSVWASPV